MIREFGVSTVTGFCTFMNAIECGVSHFGILKMVYGVFFAKRSPSPSPCAFRDRCMEENRSLEFLGLQGNSNPTVIELIFYICCFILPILLPRWLRGFNQKPSIFVGMYRIVNIGVKQTGQYSTTRYEYNGHGDRSDQATVVGAQQGMGTGQHVYVSASLN